MIRRAAERDLDAAAETLALAFADDAGWNWPFKEVSSEAPRHDHGALTPIFRFLAEAVLAYDGAWVNEDGAAVAIWVPPGCPELSPEDEGRVRSLVLEVCGPVAGPRMVQLMDEFGESHPAEPAHHYLSLLGTRPDRAGRGLGIALVEHELARIDAAGEVAYVEATTAANVRRYERVGFTVERVVDVAEGEVAISQMWRRPGGRSS